MNFILQLDSFGAVGSYCGEYDKYDQGTPTQLERDKVLIFHSDKRLSLKEMKILVLFRSLLAAGEQDLFTLPESIKGYRWLDRKQIEKAKKVAERATYEGIGFKGVYDVAKNIYITEDYTPLGIETKVTHKDVLNDFQTPLTVIPNKGEELTKQDLQQIRRGFPDMKKISAIYAELEDVILPLIGHIITYEAGAAKCK